MKIPAFKLKCKCPKCGGGGIKARHEVPIDHDPCWYDRKYNPPGKWPEHEYMHRTCPTCGYDWPEACMSSSNKAA